MTNNNGLKRFTDAQAANYDIALSEIQSGSKRSHWMWYIFPQVQGLGFSAASKFYAIKNEKEAAEYLNHPVLGARLIAICHELIGLTENNAGRIFGSPDDRKLKSSMTLFSSVPGADPVFESVLIKFFNGQKDLTTQKILNAQQR